MIYKFEEQSTDILCSRRRLSKLLRPQRKVPTGQMWNCEGGKDEDDHHHHHHHHHSVGHGHGHDLMIVVEHDDSQEEDVEDEFTQVFFWHVFKHF